MFGLGQVSGVDVALDVGNVDRHPANNTSIGHPPFASAFLSLLPTSSVSGCSARAGGDSRRNPLPCTAAAPFATPGSKARRAGSRQI
jgi:hypothetical protein